MGRRAPRPGARRLRAALAAGAIAVATLASGAAPIAAAAPPARPHASPAPRPTSGAAAEVTPGDPALTVTLAGTGTGTVTSTPIGIDCGSTCSATFAAGTEVTLIAVAATGSRFSGWTGACSGTAACAVTMADAAAVTATFDDAIAPVVHVTVDGGIPSTEDRTLRIAVTATDNQGADLTMRFGAALTGTAVTLGDPQPLAAAFTLDLPPASPSGSYTVVVRVIDPNANAAQSSAVIVYLIPDQTTVKLVPSYKLAATLDYAAARLTVVETVTVTNGSDQALGSLAFSVLAHAYGELVLSGAVTVDGHAATPTWPNSAELRVPLASDLLPGKATTVVIRFVATAKTDVSDSLRARFSKAVDSNGVVMLQVSSWYPLLSTDHGLRNPGDSQFSVAAPVTLTLDYPTTVVVAGVAKSLRIAAPGVVTTAASATAGHTVMTVKLSGAREIAFAASPRFIASVATTTRLSSLGHAIKVSTFYLSGESGAAAAVNARNVLDSLIAAYGAYPYDRFVIARSTRSTSGNEYSGIVFLGHSRIGSSYAVAHETAHQWFYHLVGNDQLRSPWLDEGFTEYAGRVAIGLAMPSVCSSKPVDLSVYAFPNQPADNTCGGYNQTVYYKTCALLSGIRARLGASAFGSAMREIVSTFRGKVVTEADVVAIFERHAANRSALDSFLYGGYLTPPVAAR